MAVDSRSWGSSLRRAVSEEDEASRSPPPCALCADASLAAAKRFNLPSGSVLDLNRKHFVHNRRETPSKLTVTLDELEEVLCHLGMEHRDLEVVDLSFFASSGERRNGDHLVRALVRSRLLRQCRQLRELRLCGCGITGDTLKKLIDEIAGLRWNEWEEWAASSGEVELSSGLDLHLNGNPLSTESVVALSRLIAGPGGSAQFIRSLHLEDVPLSAEAAVSLCEAVAMDTRIEELRFCVPASVMDGFNDRVRVHMLEGLLAWFGSRSRRDGAASLGRDGCNNALFRSLGRNHYALQTLHIGVGAKHSLERQEAVAKACRTITTRNETIKQEGHHLSKHEACLSGVQLQELRGDEDGRLAVRSVQRLSLQPPGPFSGFLDMFSSLVYLNITNCGLTEVPHGALQHTQLKGLYLAGNRIGALPQEMTKMKKLVELDLRGNPLRTTDQDCHILVLKGKHLIATFLKRWVRWEQKRWFTGGYLMKELTLRPSEGRQN